MPSLICMFVFSGPTSSDATLVSYKIASLVFDVFSAFSRLGKSSSILDVSGDDVAIPPYLEAQGASFASFSLSNRG